MLWVLHADRLHRAGALVLQLLRLMAASSSHLHPPLENRPWQWHLPQPEMPGRLQPPGLGTALGQWLADAEVQQHSPLAPVQNDLWVVYTAEPLVGSHSSSNTTSLSFACHLMLPSLPHTFPLRAWLAWNCHFRLYFWGSLSKILPLPFGGVIYKFLSLYLTGVSAFSSTLITG